MALVDATPIIEIVTEFNQSEMLKESDYMSINEPMLF